MKTSRDHSQTLETRLFVCAQITCLVSMQNIRIIDQAQGLDGWILAMFFFCAVMVF